MFQNRSKPGSTSQPSSCSTEVASSTSRHEMEVDAEPLLHPLEPDEFPVVGHVAHVLALDRRRPADDLVAASDEALDVETPHGTAGIEVHRLEGDDELGRPSRVVDGALHVPDAVPLEHEITILDDESVLPGRDGIRLEEVAVAVVVEGIEAEADRVAGAERRIALHLLGDDAGGIGIEAPDDDVEVIGIHEEPDLGPLARLGSLDRAVLGEVVDRIGGGPDRVVEHAVDHGRIDERDIGHAGAPGGAGFADPGEVLLVGILRPGLRPLPRRRTERRRRVRNAAATVGRRVLPSAERAERLRRPEEDPCDAHDRDRVREPASFSCPRDSARCSRTDDETPRHLPSAFLSPLVPTLLFPSRSCPRPRRPRRPPRSRPFRPIFPNIGSMNASVRTGSGASSPLSTVVCRRIRFSARCTRRTTSTARKRVCATSSSSASADRRTIRPGAGIRGCGCVTRLFPSTSPPAIAGSASWTRRSSRPICPRMPCPSSVPSSPWWPTTW